MLNLFLKQKLKFTKVFIFLTKKKKILKLEFVSLVTTIGRHWLSFAAIAASRWTETTGVGTLPEILKILK